MADANSSIDARTFGDASSPNALNSPTQSSPSPRPSTNRPSERTASDAAWRGLFPGA